MLDHTGVLPYYQHQPQPAISYSINNHHHHSTPTNDSLLTHQNSQFRHNVYADDTNNNNAVFCSSTTSHFDQSAGSIDIMDHDTITDSRRNCRQQAHQSRMGIKRELIDDDPMVLARRHCHRHQSSQEEEDADSSPILSALPAMAHQQRVVVDSSPRSFLDASSTTPLVSSNEYADNCVVDYDQANDDMNNVPFREILRLLRKEMREKTEVGNWVDINVC